MTDSLKHFGQRVREIRLAAGFSQEQLAERASLHRTYIGGIERGERNVSLINIHAIANALNQPPAALFASEPEKRTRTSAPVGGATK